MTDRIAGLVGRVKTTAQLQAEQPKCDLCGQPNRQSTWHQPLSPYCGSCESNKYKNALKVAAVEYKGGCCQLCGYARCINALDFHHVDPNSKDFDIAANVSNNKVDLLAELDKCVLLCSNCHRETHAALRAAELGQFRHEILDEVDAIHASWKPKTVDWEKARRNWKQHHSRYRPPIQTAEAHLAV